MLALAEARNDTRLLPARLVNLLCRSFEDVLNPMVILGQRAIQEERKMISGRESNHLLRAKQVRMRA